MKLDKEVGAFRHPFLTTLRNPTSQFFAGFVQVFSRENQVILGDGLDIAFHRISPIFERSFGSSFERMGVEDTPV